MNKKKIIIMAGIVLAAGIAIGGIIFFSSKKDDKNISIALACKMLTLLETDKETAMTVDSYFEEPADIWYEKYMNYMYSKDYIDIDRKSANKSYTYEDLRYYLNTKEISNSIIKEATGIDISKYKDKKKISNKIFMEIYDYLVTAAGTDTQIQSIELIVTGTPSNTESAKTWQAYTTRGEYGFEGLALDKYIDNRILVYVRGDEIAAVSVKISDSVVYTNVWLEKGQDTSLTAYISGVTRNFSLNKLESDFEKAVGDIYIENGKITSITLKNDRINGKVLMADDKQIEIEGYGVLELDSDFHVYRTYGATKQEQLSDILVGYSMTDFVVADKKICAALITKSLTADNIRVMIMSSGYTSLFHERVSITGTSDFTISYNDECENHKAGEIIDIYDGSPYSDKGRLTIETADNSGKITVYNVERSYGNPSYGGTIEVSRYDEGWAIVNDIAIEDYLCAVVPSEMPNRFGVEALKVQAVCARSYAYRQLVNNAYGKYGAHVDDSVNYQVYNNVTEKEDSIEAVKETYGQVAAYNGTPITTYYYSTSCGHTSDVSVWGGNPASTPYLTAKTVDEKGEYTDLSSEEAFKTFIESQDEKSFDYGFGFYRWKVTMSMSELTTSINENIYSRYCADPSHIKVLRDDNWVSEEIQNIGSLCSIEVVKRSTGGDLMCIILHGTNETVKVDNELNIRYLLSPRDNPITLLLGDTTTFYILPSAYCRFEPYYENDGISGYLIEGGGYGHGIGMSQNGVSNMVAAGMTYDEILKFFYEGTEIINVYENE